MILEVTGTNTWNKGAELMLVAIRDHYASCPTSTSLAVSGEFGTANSRLKYGLMSMQRPPFLSRLGLGLALIGSTAARALGVVTIDDTDAVLDASGFAFGDQHPPIRTERFAEDVKRWKRLGKKVILLPQALGPFRIPRIRKAFSEVMSHVDLVFARDTHSFEYARELQSKDNLRQAPDFTNLIQLDVPQPSNRATIVPNQRMIEKASSHDEADAYVPLIANCIRNVATRGLEPVLLVHGESDAGLLDPIRKAVRQEIDVVQLDDPLEIKSFLASSAVVIGSRFHALVSALSEGVPCIATSWSHKYEMLFNDYECEGLILPVKAQVHEIDECLELVTGSGRGELVSRIKRNAMRLREKSKEMWDQVDRELGLAA